MTTQITPADIFAADQVLTIEKAKQLIGKRLLCTFPVYHMNHLVVEEVVINSVEESNRPGVLRLVAENPNTGIYFAHLNEYQNYFTCGDIDRPVYFVEA